MSRDGIVSFLQNELSSLISIATAVIVASVGLVIWSRNSVLPPISYGDAANMIVAFVALMSLYIAWRELIRKTRVNITLDYDFEDSKIRSKERTLVVKLINTGENIITPVNVEYGVVRKTDNGFYFSNYKHGYFDDDVLRPGDSTQVSVDGEVVIVQFTNVLVRDWGGSVQRIEDLSKDEVNITPIVEDDRDLQEKLQRTFFQIMGLKRTVGITIGFNELEELDQEEILEEYGLTDELRIARPAE